MDFEQRDSSRMILAPERALSLLAMTFVVFAGSILAFRH